jgi:hypothetical protein
MVGPEAVCREAEMETEDENRLWDPWACFELPSFPWIVKRLRQIVMLDDRTRNYGEKGCDDKRKF